MKQKQQKTMKCRKCGNTMYQGSGYFPTDYMCNNCGAEYNASGDILAPRSQWGEETGEVF